MSGAVQGFAARAAVAALALVSVAGCRDWDRAYDDCADAGVCYDPAAPVLALTTDALADAYQSVPYTGPLSISGGRAPYTVSVTQGLPTGMSVSAGGLAGTPTVSGTFALSLRVTDALGAQVEKALSLKVVPPPAVGAAVADGYVGETSATSLSATGGKTPYAFGVLSGTLPAGVDLTSAGALVGAFTQAGSYDFTVQVTDANGLTASRALRVVVYLPVALAASTLADAYTDLGYTHAFLGSGGKAPLTYGVASGALPAGLTLSAEGVLTGQPTGTGNSNFAIEVSDANGRKATRPFSLASFAPPAIGAITAPDAYTDVSYALTLPVTGGKPTVTLAFISGTLPAGLSLSGTTITGQATVAGATANLTLQATDGNGRTATQPFTLSTYARPAIDAVTLADAYTDRTYSHTLTTTGGKGTLRFSVVSAAPPAGITLANTGTLSGTATTANLTSVFTVDATDENGRTSLPRALTLSTYAPPSFTVPSPMPPAYAGEAYSQTFTTSGGKGVLVFTRPSGSEPAGLALDAGGTVSGTVGNAVTQDANVTFRVRATDANGRNDEKDVTITTYQPPVIVTSSLEGATEGVTYRGVYGEAVTIQGTNGASPYVITSTSVPAGLTLAGSGTLAGIPAQGSAGTKTIPFVLTDANGRKATQTLALVISAARPLSGGGTRGSPPSGSPITTALTVFVTDSRGNALSGIGVRLRKNGLEYDPAKQLLTDTSGKAFFDGLDLNGTSDTVDITVNGTGIANTTLAKVNASLVTVVPFSYPVPLPRFGASALWHQPRARLLLTQGGDEGRRTTGWLTGDTLSFSPATNTWSELVPPGMINAPPPRMHAALGRVGTFSDASQVHILFGGYDAGNGLLLDDTWEFNGATDTWTRIPIPTEAAPMPRMAAATVTDTTGTLWLFGGESLMTGPLTDLWRYNAADRRWEQVLPTNGGPSSTVGMAAAAEPGKLWFCGGGSSAWNTDAVADCWTYDTMANAWAAGPLLPRAVAFASMAYLPKTGGGDLFLFGGRAGTEPVNDLLKLTGGAWVAEPVTAPWPKARFAANLVDATSTLGLFLFGGTTVADSSTRRADPFSDMWSYKPGSGWTLRTPDATPAGLTLSGSISGASATTRSTARIYVSSDAGFSTSVIADVAAGTGSYSIPGLPANATLKVHAINVAPNAGVPGSYYSFKDLGTLGPLTADATLDVVFPGAVAATQTLATVVPPTSWTPGAGTLLGGPIASRAGYTSVTNGVGPLVSGTNQVQLLYYPVAGATQYTSLYGYSMEPTECQYRYVYPTAVVSGANLGTFTLPDAITGQTQGRIDCDQTGDGFGAMTFGKFIGNGAGATAAGNLNGDGRDDVVALYASTSKVGVFLSLAVNTRRVADVTIGANALAIALGDVVGDADVDLVVAYAGGGLSLYEGDGAGGFTPAGAYAEAFENPTQLLVHDLTGDGVRDVVVIDAGGTGQARATLFERVATGGLTGYPGVALGLGGQWRGAIAQVAPNTSALMAVSPATAGILRVTHAPATESHLQASNLGFSGEGYEDVALADFVGDGFADVVAVNSKLAVVDVIENSGGNFLASGLTAVTVPCGPGRVLGMQMRPGGSSEIVAMCSERVVTLQSIGGVWSPLQILNDAVGDVVPLDFDGNGVPDLMRAGSFQALTPGRHPFTTPSDASYAFTAPAGTNVFFSVRMALGGAIEWQYTAPASPGAVTFAYPAPSTLASSRPWPAGRNVVWDQNVRSFGPGWNYNHSSTVADRLTQYVGTSYFVYRR